MSWTVTVEPVPADEHPDCQGTLGRMAKGDGICPKPAKYRLRAGDMISHACPHHLRAELDLLGSIAARRNTDASP